MLWLEYLTQTHEFFTQKMKFLNKKNKFLNEKIIFSTKKWNFLQKNSLKFIVDRIKKTSDDLEGFARDFKQRRIKLGYTQVQ